MDSGLVTLYTSSEMDDPSPCTFQYYLDYTGSECLNIAMQNIGMVQLPGYKLLLRTNQTNQWLDTSLTLRAQGVQTGNMIIILPSFFDIPTDNFNSVDDAFFLNSSTGFGSLPLPSPLSESLLPPIIHNNVQPSVLEPSQMIPSDIIGTTLPVLNDEPNASGDYPITIEAINIDDVEPMRIEAMMPTSNTSGSESDSEDEGADFDIFIGDQETDFQTNNFGSFRNYEMNEQTPQAPRGKGKDVRLITNDGFKKGGNIFSYNISCSFNELLDEALKNLKINREGSFSILIDKANERKVIHEDQYLEEFNPIDNESIFIFKNEQLIKVHSDNFSPKSMLLDISKTVEEIIFDVAQHFDMDSYFTYGLFSYNEKLRPKPLESHLTVPQQTKSMKKLYFVRQYFVFSREDLSTMESAKIAIKDAIRQLVKDEVFLNEEDAAKIMALYAIANSGSSYNVEIDKYLDQQDKILPVSCKSMKLSFKVKAAMKTYKDVDRFNAIRMILRFLRALPGFGCYNFIDNYVELKYRGKKESYRLIIQVAPYCLRLINFTNSCLEERISYSTIVSMDLLGNTLQIQFSAGNDKTAKYKIIGKDSERIKFLIDEYTKISRKIQQKRAKDRADKFGGQVIDIIDERDRIYLFTALSLTEENPKRFQYDLKFTGAVMIQYAEQNLGIPHDEDHVLLIRMLENMYYWIKPDTILRLLSVQNGMTIYLLKNKRPIDIYFSDGHRSAIILDITKPIEELIAPIFESQKMPPIVGYTLFNMEDPNNPKPLDTRFSIPEVCKKWDKLLFKRRFYVISGEVLSNQIAAHSTLCDCREHFLYGTCIATDDEIIELAILGLYAMANDPSDVKRMTNIDISQHVPRGFKVTKKFSAKFMEKLANSVPNDRFPSAKSYLGKVRRLKGFGEEKFTVIYTDLSFMFKGTLKVIRDVTLLIGPLRIKILMPPEKGEEKLLQTIPYRLLISFESLGHRLILRFMNTESKIISVELKIRDIDTVLMLINFNIKIIRDLMLAKQRKKAREIEDSAKKLNGGWIDETGVLRTKMIDFYVTKDLTKTEGFAKIWLELEQTGAEVTKYLTPHLRLDSSIEWAILMKLVRQQWKWIPPDKALEIANPERCSILFILVAKPMIRVFFSMGVTKAIILPIYKTVAQLVPIIANKLSLANTIGFTLYLPKGEGQDPLPLDTNISVPEQTPKYDELLFKRRFFVISKFDTDDDNSLYQTFCDVRELILSGRVDMTSESALRLMYYALKVDYKLPLSKDTIPKDPSEYLPKGMKPKEKVNKFMLDMMKRFCIKNRRDAMLDYIRIARSLPTFGTEKYEIILVEEKKDIVERTKCYVFVGPYRVIIKDENCKKELYSIPYKRLLCVDYTDEELSIKYRRENNIEKALFVHIESAKSPQIADLIMSHIQIHKQILMKRIETGDDEQPSDRIEMITLFCFDIEHAQKCVYDIRMDGKTVVQHACRYLGLDPEGQYSCLLRICEDQFEWIQNDTVLGTLNPVNGLTIHLYFEYMPIQITAPVTGYVRTMLLRVSKPIRRLIDEISFKMFIDNPTGYTLYFEDNSKIIPLDLNQTIPEQVFDFSKLIFKRRFLVFTSSDVRSPIISKQLFSDIRESIVKSTIISAPTNQLLELVCYDLIASAKTYNEKQPLPIPNDITPYLPKNIEIKPDFQNKIMSAITSRSSSKMTQEKAITNYISNACKLRNFGCEIYQCYDFPTTGEKKREKAKKRQLKIAVGPNSIIIFDPQTKKDIIYSPHKSIIKIKQIKNNVIMTMSSGSGANTKLNKFVIVSNKASAITKILTNYRRVVLPALSDRDRIQKQSTTLPMLQQLLEPSNFVHNGVKVKISRQINHPSAPIYQLSKKYTCDHAISVGLYNINYPREGEYMMLTTNNRKKIDTEYNWLAYEDSVAEANLVDNAHVFFVKEMPYIQVLASTNGHVKEIYISMRKNIFDICTQLTVQFDLGFPLGFTFYEIWNGKRRPLDFLFNIISTTENYTEVIIQRRFFLFTSDILKDLTTLKSAFRDVNNQLRSGTISVSDETAVELAVYSLYTKVSKPSEVIQMIPNMTEEKLSQLMPINMKVSSATIRKFAAVATVITPIDPIQASLKYIILVNSCPGFGVEEYTCLYSELNSISVINVSAKIRLGPYFISIVKDDKNNTEIIRFEWANIIDFKRDEIIVSVKYQDNSGLFYDVNLETEENAREIFSFINDMLYLIQKPDFAYLGNLDVENEHKNIDDFEFTLDLNDDVNHADFVDIDEINTTANEQAFDNFDINYDDNDYNEHNQRYTNFENGDEDSDWTWRATDEGLKTIRANLIIDTLERDLRLTNLDNLDPDDLLDHFNFMNDELKRFDGYDDDDKYQFITLNGFLDSLRETTTDKINGNYSDEEYKDALSSQLASALDAFKGAKTHFDNQIKSIKAKHNDFIDEDNFGSDLKVNAEVSFNLLGLSQLLENLNSTLVLKNPELKQVASEIAELSNNFTDQSNSATSLAALFLQNKDFSLIPQLVSPLIGQIRAGRVQLKDILSSKGMEIEEIEDVLSNLDSHLSKIENMHDFSADISHKTARYTLWPGDNKGIPGVVNKIQDVNDLLGTIKDVEAINSNSQLHSLIQQTGKLCTLSINSLTQKAKQLQLNILNDSARAEALQTLNKLKESLATVQPQLAEIEAQDPNVKKLGKSMKKAIHSIDDELLHISTINIIPANIQAIESDLSNLNDRFTALNPEIKKKVLAQDGAENALKSIHESRFLISGLLNHLQNNPSSGEVVAKIQKVVCELNEQLPVIRKFGRMVEKSAKDPIFPVVIERLSANIKSSLFELPPSEDVSKCAHVAKFRQVQIDTGKIINQLKQTMDNTQIKNNQEFVERISSLYNRAIQSYYKQVDIRKDLQAHPFNAESIDRGIALIEELGNTVGKIQSAARQVTQSSLNVLLGNSVNSLLANMKKAVDSLENAPLGVFYKPPNDSTIEEFDNLLNGFTNKLAEKIETSSIRNQPSVYNDLNSKLKNLLPIIPRYLDAGKLKNFDFYNMTPAIKDLISNIKTSTDPLDEMDDINDLLNTLIDKFDQLMKGDIPDIDTSFACLQNTTVALNNFSDLTELLSAKPNLSPEAKAILDDLIARSKELNVALIKDVENRQEDTLGHDKELLLEYTPSITQIPAPVRAALDQGEFGKLITSISSLTSAANFAVRSIRQLPIKLKIAIDDSKFKRISKDDELSDSIPIVKEQCELMENQLKKLLDHPQLKDRKATLSLINEMIKTFEPLRKFKDNLSEKELLKILNKLKEAKVFMKESAELISPIVDDKKLALCERVRMDNIMSLIRALQEPHITAKTSTKLIKELQPELETIDPSLQKFKERDDVKNLEDFNKLLNSYYDFIKNAKVGVISPKKVEQQKIVDELYRQSGAILPTLMENPDFGDFQQQVTDIFETCSKFTSLPLQTIRFTSPLQVKKELISQKSSFDILNKTIDTIGSDTTSLIPELADGLSDIMNSLISSPESIPFYLCHASKLSLSSLSTNSLLYASVAARTGISAFTDKTKKFELLEQLAIQTARRAAIQLSILQTPLKEQEIEVVENPDLFNERQKFWLAHTSRAYKSTDSSLLIQCPSIPTLVFDFVPMHNILQNLVQLVDSLDLAPTLRQPSKDFEDWLFQSDMAAEALFFAHMDAIAIACDDLLSLDAKIMQSNDLKDFVRTSSNLLKETDRGVFYNASTLKKLANMYNDFAGKIFEFDLKNKLNEEELKPIAYSVNSLTKIKPLINYWGNSMNNLDKFQFFSIVESCVLPTISRVNVKNEIVQNTPDVVALEMAPGNTSITRLLAAIESANEAKIRNAEKPQKIAEKAANIGLENIARPPYNPTSIRKELARLAKALSMVNDKMERYHQIDYSNVPTDAFDQREGEEFLDGIDDKDVRDKLRQVQKYMTSLSTLKIVAKHVKVNKIHLSSFGSHSPLDNDSKKYPNVGVEIQNLTDMENRGIHSIDQIREKKTNIQEDNFVSTIPMENATFNSLQNLLLSQRLMCLKQQQISEFPIILSRLEQVEEDELIHINKNEISASYDFIVKQFDKLNESKDLKNLQKNYLPDQILTQQVVISRFLREQQTNPVPAMKFVKKLNRAMKNLLIAAIDQSKSSSLKTFTDNELRLIIDRGFSHLRLVEQLTQLQQQIVAEDPSILKFAQSPEGQVILIAPLSLEQVANEQKQIAQDINLLTKPDLLSQSIKTNLSDNTIVKMRVIRGLIDVLTSEEADNFMARPVEATINGILTAAIAEQNRLIQTSSDKGSVSSIVDSETLTKSQQFTYNLNLRLNLLRRLLNAKGLQISAHPNGPRVIKTVKPNAVVTNSEVDTHMTSIINQVLSDSSPIEEIKDLTDPELISQQIVISKASSIVATGAVNLKLNLKAALHAILRSIQQEQITEMSANPDAFAGIQPLQSSYALDAYLMKDFLQVRLINSDDIRSIINMFEIIYPEIRDTSNSDKPFIIDCSDDQLIEYRSIASNLALLPPSNDIRQNIGKLNEKDRVAVYEILRSQEREIALNDYINNYNKQLLNTSFDLIENNIFTIETQRQIHQENEKLANIQLEERKIKLVNGQNSPSNDNEDKETEKDKEAEKEDNQHYPSIDNIERELIKVERAISASKILYVVDELAKRRTELYPDLIIPANSTAKIGDLSNKKLAKLIEALKEQFKSGNNLPIYMEALTSEQRIIQQLLLQHLHHQLTNDTFIAILSSSSLETIDKVSTHDLLFEALNLVLQQVATNPSLLQATKTLSLKELVDVCDNSPEHIARLTLYNKMLKYMNNSIVSLKLKDFVESPEASNKEMIAPYSLIELTPIHDYLRTALSLNSGCAESQVAHKNTNEKQQAREIRAINKLALQLKPPQLFVTLIKSKEEKHEDFRLDLNKLSSSLNAGLTIETVKLPGYIGKQTYQQQQQPGNDELHQKLMNMCRSVLTIAPSMMNLPVEESKSLLLTLTKQAVSLLTQIYNIPQLNSYPELLNVLTGTTPQLSSALVHVSKILPKDIEITPQLLLKRISKLCINGVSLNDPICIYKFDSNLSKLLNNLKQLEASLTPPLSRDDLMNQRLDTFASLASSISLLDIGKINYGFADFKARTISAKINNNDDEIAELEKAAESLQKSMHELYKSSGLPPLEFEKGDNKDDNKDDIKDDEKDDEKDDKKDDKKDDEKDDDKENDKENEEKTMHTMSESDRNDLDSFRGNLVNYITKESDNPYTIIRTLSSIPEVRNIILKCRTNLDSSLISYTSSVRAHDDESIADSLSSLMNSLSLAQAAIYQGFQIQDHKSFHIYSDAISMFSASLFNISVLVDSEQNKSSATIRRSMRALNRTINQTVDEINYFEESRNSTKVLDNAHFDGEDDLEAASLASKKKKRRSTTSTRRKKDKKQTEEGVSVDDADSTTPKLIDTKKLVFIKTLTQLAKFVSCTISAHASSRVPETRSTFAEAEKGNFNKLVIEVKEASMHLSRVNTDRQAGENFDKEINNLLSLLNEFMNFSFNSPFSVPPQSITTTLIALNKQLANTSHWANRLTDVVPLTPDILNADKLYKAFNLPQVPNDIFGIKIQDAYKPLSSLVKSFNEQIEVVFGFYRDVQQGIYIQNVVIADTMNSAADKLRVTIEQILRISTTIMNVESQNELTTVCSSVSTLFNGLLKMLRCKFLLRDDSWDEKSEKQMKSITKELKKAQKVSKKEKDQGVAEQKHSDLVGRLKLSYDKLLAAQFALQLSLDRMKSRPTTINREWGMRIVEIGLCCVTTTLRFMIRFAEKPEEILAIFEKLLSFADSLTTEANEIHKQASQLETANSTTTDVEGFVIKRNLKLVQIIEIFVNNYIENTANIDERNLVVDLKRINLNVESLTKTANASISSKNTKNSMNEFKLGDNSSTTKRTFENTYSRRRNNEQIRDELMTRLELESKVIKARLLLSKSEKKLKELKKI